MDVLFSFFFSSRRRHTRSKRDWSSDVCSSDLIVGPELLCILRVQALPAAELHDLGADDASHGLTGEQPLQHIEADEIGRASCRERVERSGVEAGVEKNEMTRTGKRILEETPNA